tara:strand:- start:754 stop:930 length:177 start_codon:yes stop_codon:yes gene_type:complete
MTDYNDGWTEDLHRYLVHIVEEDLLEVCESHGVNASMGWLIIQSLSTAKIEQLKGNRL